MRFYLFHQVAGAGTSEYPAGPASGDEMGTAEVRTKNGGKKENRWMIRDKDGKVSFSFSCRGGFSFSLTNRLTIVPF